MIPSTPDLFHMTVDVVFVCQTSETCLAQVDNYYQTVNITIT